MPQQLNHYATLLSAFALTHYINMARDASTLVLAGRCEKRLYNSDLYSRLHRRNFEQN